MWMWMSPLLCRIYLNTKVIPYPPPTSYKSVERVSGQRESSPSQHTLEGSASLSSIDIILLSSLFISSSFTGKRVFVVVCERHVSHSVSNFELDCIIGKHNVGSYVCCPLDYYNFCIIYTSRHKVTTNERVIWQPITMCVMTACALL